MRLAALGPVLRAEPPVFIRADNVRRIKDAPRRAAREAVRAVTLHPVQILDVADRRT